MYGKFKKIRDLMKVKPYLLKPIISPKPRGGVPKVMPPRQPLVKNLLATPGIPITEITSAPKANAVDWRKMNLTPDLN